MSGDDVSHYLKRIRFHRAMRRNAQCIEARLCHQGVEDAYRGGLAEIRVRRAPRHRRSSADAEYYC